MLSLLKKPSEKPAVSLMPAWHPDFRNTSRLPDTKVVRTSFFVNGVAIMVTLVLALYVVYSEYSLHNIRGQIADGQRQIDSDKMGSDRALILFKKFQEEEKKLIELRDFQASKIAGSDFLVHLGKSLPPGVVLNSVDYGPAKILLRGHVYGPPDDAIGHASAYVDALGKYPALAPLFETITLTGINRDQAVDRLNIEILLKFKGAQKTPQK